MKSTEYIDPCAATPHQRTDPDQRMEAAIGEMLRWGVMLSGLVMVVGGVLFLIHATTNPVDYRTFHAVAPDLRTVSGILAGIRVLNPASLIQLGVLLLIATPVVRVLCCVVGFALQRDRIYVVVSSIVMAILLYSLIHASR